MRRGRKQASDEPAWVLAERFGTTEQTVYKWRHRDSIHTPRRLQTTLNPAQEAVALRTTLLVSLNDLLAVAREFLNPNASRSGLDRCLRRYGVGNLRDLKTKTAANARRFLRDLERTCPVLIRTILTDNGKEFTDRLFGLRKRAATGEHEFDRFCAALEIERRLTPPKSPQTNGMVERFNGRIEEVLQSHRFRSGEELETALHRYVGLYNQQLPQSVLSSKTPLQAMKEWHKLKPGLFKNSHIIFRDVTPTHANRCIQNGTHTH